jgi:hypothetical protein
MIKMGLKRKTFIGVMIGVFILFFLLKIGISEATRRSMSLNELMEKSFVRTRKVAINGKLFDIFINNAEESITVRGEVEDWEEKDRVEQYFRLRAPSGYHVNYDIKIVY